MSVTFGFYNSVNGDRKYDAIQMSSIFDGIIRDGVFQHLGTAMMVKESEGMIVNVGIGRAWFNHTWTLNDALLPLEVPISEVILNRIDAVVLEVDARENSRANSIKIIKGTPASSPKNPEMIKTNDRWQYPLAYIQVNAGVTSIRQANITNCVGTSDCPFVTGPLELMSIDALVAQWGDQWKEFYENQTSDMESTNSSGLRGIRRRLLRWKLRMLSGSVSGKSGFITMSTAILLRWQSGERTQQIFSGNGSMIYRLFWKAMPLQILQISYSCCRREQKCLNDLKVTLRQNLPYIISSMTMVTKP